MYGWKHRALRIDITVGDMKISHPDQIKELLGELAFVENNGRPRLERDWRGLITDANGKIVGLWQIADFEVDPEEL